MLYYISQLFDGKMLVYDDDTDEVFIENTGYPYKDCSYEDVNGNRDAFFKFVGAKNSFMVDYNTIIKFILTFVDSSRINRDSFIKELRKQDIDDLYFLYRFSKYIQDLKISHEYELKSGHAVITPSDKSISLDGLNVISSDYNYLFELESKKDIIFMMSYRVHPKAFILSKEKNIDEAIKFIYCCNVGIDIEDVLVELEYKDKNNVHVSFEILNNSNYTLMEVPFLDYTIKSRKLR